MGWFVTHLQTRRAWVNRVEGSDEEAGTVGLIDVEALWWLCDEGDMAPQQLFGGSAPFLLSLPTRRGYFRAVPDPPCSMGSVVRSPTRCGSRHYRGKSETRSPRTGPKLPKGYWLPPI